MSYCFNPNCIQPTNSAKEKICLHCNTSLLLANRYRGLKIIGRGGMGRTFLCVDKKHSQKDFLCVIKQLYSKASHLQSRETLERLFATEAAILHKLGQHPQIPELYDRFDLNGD